MTLYHRDLHLEQVTSESQPWDVVIIGGGASGVGAALDGALRGLKVVLLEAHDFGKGTSSRSTKLIHGGVRYLRQGNFSLVRESLQERSRLLRNAPHVVHPLEFLLPCRGRWEMAFYGIGMKVYDWLAKGNAFSPSSRLNAQQALSKLPQLSPKALYGAISYFDGQFDDSRLLINLAQSAAEHGAKLINGAKVIALTKNGSNHVDGVQFIDEETGKEHRVRAGCVVNATGPFCDSIRRLDRPSEAPLVAASQGIHLVLPGSFFPGDAALIVPKTKDGRVIFIIPWHGHTLLGTTDTPIQEIRSEPKAMQEEIDFLLDTAAEYTQSPATRQECLSVFTGIRPLVKALPGASTASLARDHTLEVSPSKLLTLTGGKWTTYRQMAEDCIDRVFELLDRKKVPCCTMDFRLHGCPVENSQVLNRSVYGSDQREIDRLAIERPDLPDQLHPDLMIRGAEIVWGVQKEWARSVEDLLARRTRSLFLNARASIEISHNVAKIMAKELQKDSSWEESQVKQFRAIAERFLPES